MPDLFGNAPTATNEVISSSARQPYGSSSLPGAPVANGDISPPPMVIYDPNTPTQGGSSAPSSGSGAPTTRTIAAPTGPALDTNPGGQLPLSGPTSSGGVGIATIAPAQQTQTTTTATTPPAGTPTTTGPTPDAGTGDPMLAGLLALANADRAGGGGGGVVALPTQIDSGGGTASGGLSMAKIALAVALVALVVYLYIRHKNKKKKEAGGGERSETREPPR